MTSEQRTRAKLLLFLVLLATLLLATGVLRAQIATHTGDIGEAADALPDMAFFSAGDLTVTAKSTDDIFAAGGDLNFDPSFTIGGSAMLTQGGKALAVEKAE